MGKRNKNQRKKEYKRFLTIFLICVLFFSKFLFAEEELFEIKYSTNEIYLDENFILEIKINDKHNEYKLFLDSPKIIIENKAIELLESKITNIYSGTLIKNKYKLNKTGEYSIKPKIKSKNTIKNLKPFVLNIHPPELSNNTSFDWIICKNDKNFTPENRIYKNTKYIIILAGFFSNYNDYNFEINSPAPEYTILELYDKNKINKSELLNINKIVSEYFNEYGWNFVEIFYWTPLKDGNLYLPTPIIKVKTNNIIKKIIVNTKIINIKKKENKKLITSNENIANKTLRLALQKTDYKNKNQNLISDFDFNKKQKIAIEIANLRSQESKKILNAEMNKKRILLEKKLGIYDSIQVHPQIIQKIIIIFIFLIAFILIFILVLKSNKKNKGIFFITLLFILPIAFYVIFYAYFFKFTKYKKAVYVPRTKNTKGYIYHIPEETGTILGTIKIGEAVFIIQETNKWILIEKKDGTGGWQKKENFLLYN